jgi:hypothetical protein
MLRYLEQWYFTAWTYFCLKLKYKKRCSRIRSTWGSDLQTKKWTVVNEDRRVLFQQNYTQKIAVDQNPYNAAYTSTSIYILYSILNNINT